MPTIQAGTQIKTSNDYIEEIYEALGSRGFPLAVQVSSDGKLVNLSVETEWKEGSTTPVEGEVEIEKTVVNDDGEEETIVETETQIVDYEEDYTEHALTQPQIDALEEYIQNNIEQ